MKNLANRKFLGLLLIIEGLLILVPTIVLGLAINWPQILGEPASVVLPLINQNSTATFLGYFGYLIYSILFFPAIALVSMYVLKEEKITATLNLAIIFSALSTLARSIGIIRWLTIMPWLANMYQQSSASNEVINIVYQAINQYGGSIGEDLGVSIFASLSVGLLSFYVIKHQVLPKSIAWLGLISAFAILIPALGIFGIDVGIFNIISVSAIQLWFMVLGTYFFIKER